MCLFTAFSPLGTELTKLPKLGLSSQSSGGLELEILLAQPPEKLGLQAQSPGPKSHTF